MSGHDLALGAHYALGHRGLGDEECGGDLGGREARHRAERQRDLRFLRKGRVAAREDQAEAIVGLGRVTWQCRPLQQRQLLGVAAIAAHKVDRAPAGGGHEPRPRVVGNALLRPSLERRDQTVLHDLLGNVEVAEDPDHGSGQPPGLLPEDRRDRCFCGRSSCAQAPYRSTAGQISTGPAGQVLAISSASS